MNTTETIEWHPASEPPDNDRTVLRFSPENRHAWLAYYDFEREEPTWCAIDGFPIPAPDYWAELPRGPRP